MKRNIEETVEIPEGYQIEINKEEISLKHQGKEIKKIFPVNKIVFAKEGNKIKITAKNATKKEAKLVGTSVAHLNNMIDGMKEEYGYRLEVCNVHFPMVIKADNTKVTIKNFLGETVDRHADIAPNAKVEVKGNMIFVTSFDREAAGQTSANIEIATKIRNRDRRVFQDGIFLVEKYRSKK